MSFKPNTDYTFTEELMKSLHIAPVTPIDGRIEVWRTAVFDRDEYMNDFGFYLVSNYGRVYNIKKQRMVMQEDSTFSKGTTKGKYKQVRCNFGIYARSTVYFVHRLVALTFIERDKTRPLVNHIDGIPYHNYVWNLEWCDTRENYVHALKMGLKVDARGEKRSNAKWTDEEIHMICKMMEEGHKATYIFRILAEMLKDPKVEYERVKTLVKHIRQQTHWTHISSQYDIDFSKFNYAKEKKSVKKAKKREKKRKSITYVYDKYE